MLRAIVGGALTGVLAHLAGRRAGRRRLPAPLAQLTFDFAAPQPPPPRPALRTAEELLGRLRTLGLAPSAIDRCRLTRNRTVMVSFKAGELRVHRGFLAAPDEVLDAIVAFVHARTRAQRTAAQRVILAHPVQGGDGDATSHARPRRREATHPEDAAMVRVLVEWHHRYNARYFHGELRTVPIRVSRRLKRRLGHYTAAIPSGAPAEIVIGRSHIRRHGWEEALHTLLHEMVHQWQDETGHAIDHGRSFRQKAREVGITAAARRVVGRRGETAA